MIHIKLDPVDVEDLVSVLLRRLGPPPASPSELSRVARVQELDQKIAEAQAELFQLHEARCRLKPGVDAQLVLEAIWPIVRDLQAHLAAWVPVSGEGWWSVLRHLVHRLGDQLGEEGPA